MEVTRPGVHKVFCIKDNKAADYGPLITVQTTGLFLRQVSESISDGKATFAKHPADFTLFELGEYDTISGVYVPHESKKNLGLVSEFKM